MAVLSAAARKRLPASVFAGPDRSYPVPDKAHARVALGRATQMRKRGKLSSAAASRIRAKAKRILGRE